MAETQPQPNYRYIPSSAQSTRQILDSTSPSTSTSTNPNEVPFRPQNFTRKSSNYAEADARARAAVAEMHTSIAQGDDTQEVGKDKENTDAAAPVSPSTSWRPKYGRKQSWSQQDFKREMHMSTVADAGKGHGFTEAGKRIDNER